MSLLRKIPFKKYRMGLTLSLSALATMGVNGKHFSTVCEPKSPIMWNSKSPLPPFNQILPSQVVPAITANIGTLKSDFSAFEATLSSTNANQLGYKDVVEKLEEIQHPLGYSWNIVNHLMGVKNSDELRDAHKTMQPSVIQLHQQMGQSKPIYSALSALHDRVDLWSSLDEPKQRIVTSSLRDMKNSGVGLEGEARERFNKLQLEAADLSTKFSNNVLDSTKAFRLVLSDPSQVKGLPPSALALASKQAISGGEKSSNPETGPWVITLDLPSYLPAMQHLQSREMRERLYREYVTRASTGEHDNSPILLRLLQLKREMAQILGYKSHAEKSLSCKMAGTTENVSNLMELLLSSSYPFAQRDLKELEMFARGKTRVEGDKELNWLKEDEKLEPWDVPYWAERMRETLYDLSEEELRPYLPLPSVLNGLFSLSSRLFDIKITPTTACPCPNTPGSSEEGGGVGVEGCTQVWHPDVQHYEIRDNSSGELLASFFLDPYSRPGEKRGGAWMSGAVGRSEVLNTIPVAYLICNGSPPVGDAPSLMTFREVETLFHEFGHGLQHMLTRVKEGDASGISNVEWDAVELPSQFMENFCMDPRTLLSFAKHYQTGEPLPLTLLDKMKAGRNFQAGLMMLRQLNFAVLDMTLHSEGYDPSLVPGSESPAKTPFDIQREVARRFSVMPPIPEDRFLCSFSHIFAGGYSAGYYSYKWAEVMSADAFAAFEEAGLAKAGQPGPEGEEAEKRVRECGRRFRDTVLSMGGGKHPSEVFRMFRGRNPSPEALLRHNGLTPKKKIDPRPFHALQINFHMLYICTV